MVNFNLINHLLLHFFNEAKLSVKKSDSVINQ